MTMASFTIMLNYQYLTKVVLLGPGELKKRGGGIVLFCIDPVWLFLAVPWVCLQFVIVVLTKFALLDIP